MLIFDRTLQRREQHILELQKNLQESQDLAKKEAVRGPVCSLCSLLTGVQSLKASALNDMKTAKDEVTVSVPMFTNPAADLPPPATGAECR